MLKSFTYRNSCNITFWVTVQPLLSVAEMNLEMRCHYFNPKNTCKRENINLLSFVYVDI